MTIYSYPMAAVYDLVNATAVLKVPPGGIPAGSVISLFIWSTGISQIGDSAGNIYKEPLINQSGGVHFCYTYNAKALRGGDTITIRKNGPAYVLGCAYSGLVTTTDPLAFARQYDGYNTRWFAPVPQVGDLVVCGLYCSQYGTGSLYIEDALHPWNPNDFPPIKNYQGDLSDIPLFATSMTPRLPGTYSWSPQIIPYTPGGGWETVAASFNAAATVKLGSAVGITTASPALVPGIFSMFGKMAPIGITVASPVIEVPSTGNDAPQVVCLTHRDDPDTMEALFTNLNVAFTLELQPNTMVGRTSPGVGPAEQVEVIKPLLLVDKQLVLDPEYAPALLTSIYARLAAVEAAAAAALAGIATLTDNLSPVADAVTILIPAVAQLQVQVKWLGNMFSLGSGAIDLVLARPGIGTPTVAVH